jgi:hypothetical protein
MDAKFSYGHFLLEKADLIIMIGVNQKMLTSFLEKKLETTPIVLLNPIKHDITADLYI